MNRRNTVLALIALGAMPFASRAQQPRIPIIGFLRNTSLVPFENLVTAFRYGLKEAGFIEGQNVAVEYRYADNQTDRLPVLVTELLRLPAAVIVVNQGSARAAKAATTTVPIVFASGGDPVEDGLVASLNRPGGNVTGVVWYSNKLGAKRLQLLRQLVPKATTIGLLRGPRTPETEAELADMQAAAQAVGQRLIGLEVSNDRDIETAFATFVQRGVGALLVGSGAFLSSKRERVVALAAHHALPASYPNAESATAGGLMSYAASQSDAYRQAGIYTVRILKGARPADLPVIQSTKIEFVINLKTAKALGLKVPQTLQVAADELIE